VTTSIIEPASTIEPPATFDGVMNALRQVHEAGLLDPYRVLALMLIPAGAKSQWDSETIEHVLRPAETTSCAGLPWIGDTGQNEHGLWFWASVAHETGYDHDWPHACPDCDEPLFDDSDQTLTTHYQLHHRELDPLDP
jgi:hypothetical protein